MTSFYLPRRDEGPAGGPVDRDWRHNEGCHPAGGEAGSHGCRSAQKTARTPRWSAGTGCKCHALPPPQVWLLWPSRTQRVGNGSKTITNPPTASPKSCRLNWRGGTLISLKGLNTRRQKDTFGQIVYSAFLHRCYTLILER